MPTCRSAEKEPACYTDAGGTPQNVWQHTVYDANGAIFATYFAGTDGVVVDTAGGSVTPGACPVSQPDVEWEDLCDKLADGTVVPFLRRSITRFNPDGTVIDPVEVADFELDKVTAYTVAGDVVSCPECDEVAPLGLITDLTLLDN